MRIPPESSGLDWQYKLYKEAFNNFKYVKSDYLKKTYNKVIEFDVAAKLYAAINGMDYISLVDLSYPLAYSKQKLSTCIYSKNLESTINILKVYIPNFTFTTFARLASCKINSEIRLVKFSARANKYVSRSYYPEWW